MSKKDEIKEKIADLRFWLGTFVAIALTLGSWIAVNLDNSSVQIKLIFAIIGEIFVLYRIFKINKRIKSLINELREL